MKLLIASFLFSGFAFAQQDSAKIIGATLVEGQAYDVYEIQDQETTDKSLVYKKRTEKSGNPEELPTFKNLLNRQKMFEIGAAIGGADSPAGNPPGGAILFANMHPTKPSLARITVGVEFRNMGHNAGWDEGLPSGSLFQNVKGIAEYDYLVIPYEPGGMAFSAGYAFGRYKLELADHHSSTGYVDAGSSYEHFLSLRYRWILEQNFANQTNADGSVSHAVVIGYRISNKKSQEFFMGYALGFGKKASPRVKVQK